MQVSPSKNASLNELRACVRELEALQGTLKGPQNTHHISLEILSTFAQKRQDILDRLTTLRMPERNWKLAELSEKEAQNLQARLRTCLEEGAALQKVIAEHKTRLQKQMQSLRQGQNAARSYLNAARLDRQR